MKLIKIDGYWIIIDFEKENQNNFQNKFMWNEQLKIVWRHPYIFDDSEIDTLYSYEVLYSQNPKHNLPTITFSDEVAKELGIVDVERLAYDFGKRNDTRRNNPYADGFVEGCSSGFSAGYNQCLSDNKDKLFTLEQAKEIFQAGVLYSKGLAIKGKPYFDRESYFQSLTKQEYNCELEMYEPIKNSPSEVDRFIKITNNSVKVIKIIK